MNIVCRLRDSANPPFQLKLSAIEAAVRNAMGPQNTRTAQADATKILPKMLCPEVTDSQIQMDVSNLEKLG
jgi:hypothetical protein